jgi:hypothetical protein
MTNETDGAAMQEPEKPDDSAALTVGMFNKMMEKLTETVAAGQAETKAALAEIDYRLKPVEVQLGLREPRVVEAKESGPKAMPAQEARIIDGMVMAHSMSRETLKAMKAAVSDADIQAIVRDNRGGR